MKNIHKRRKVEMFKKASFFLLIIFVISMGVAFASPVSDKLDAQRALEDHVRTTLTNILGHENFVVSIDATLNTETRETLREKWEPNTNTAAVANRSYNYMLPLPTYEHDMLPGIPQKQNLESEKKVKLGAGENGDSTKITNRSYIFPSNVFKKLVVTILIDKKAKQEEVATIRQVVPKLVGIDAKRGDKFIVERVDLKGGTVSDAGVTIKNEKNELIPSLVKYFLIFGCITGFILVFFNRFKDSALGIVDALNEGKKQMPLSFLNGAEEEGPESTKLGKDLNKAMDGTVAVLEEPKHFDYISDENVTKLKYILRGEDPAVVSTILLNIDPTYSAKLLQDLPSYLQEETIIHMTQPRELIPGTLDDMENKFKVRVDNMVGGVEEFIDVFNQLGEETGKYVLSMLQSRYPDVATEVIRLKFYFEDLMLLSEKDLQTVLSHVRPKELALAMRGTAENVKEKILSNVSEEAKEIMTEWDELTPIAARAKIDEARRYIVKTVRQLEREGIIIINRAKEEPLQ